MGNNNQSQKRQIQQNAYIYSTERPATVNAYGSARVQPTPRPQPTADIFNSNYNTRTITPTPANHTINSNHNTSNRTTTSNRNTLNEWEFVNANTTPRSSTAAKKQVASSPVFQARGSQVRHEQIRIPNDAIGYGYHKVFGSILDSNITTVLVEDPYIRMVHQIYNFLRFCELLVKSCKNLREIYLTTGTEPNDERKQQQMRNLLEIKQSLQLKGIKLIIEFLNTLHDREITFDNGCIVKIGRGLDYFKKSGKFEIGFCDNDLRKCLPTTVDIFRH